MQQSSSFAQALANRGRGVDSAKRGGLMAHVSPTDVVIPGKLIDREPALLASVIKAFSKHGSDWRPHMAAMGRTNPKTGLKEFAWDDPEDNSNPLQEGQSNYFDSDGSTGGLVDVEGGDNATYTRADEDSPWEVQAPGGGGYDMPSVDSGNGPDPNDFHVALDTYGRSQPEQQPDYNFEGIGVDRVRNSPDFARPATPPPQEEPDVDELGIPSLNLNFKPSATAAPKSAASGANLSTGTMPKYEMPPATTLRASGDTPATPRPWEAGSGLTKGINGALDMANAAAKEFLPGYGAISKIGTGLGAVQNWAREHGYQVGNLPFGSEEEQLSEPGSPTDSTSYTMPQMPAPKQAIAAPSTTTDAAEPGAGTLPGGGADPWAFISQQQEQQNATNALTGNSVSANLAGSSPSLSSGFSRPTEMQSPSFLGMSGGMNPLQQRAMLATYGMNSDDPMWRDELTKEYYKNQLMRSLIRDDGTIGDMRDLLPIEHNYLQQVMGLEYAPNDTAGLVRALGGPNGTPQAAAVRPNLPHGAIPLPNGGHMAPSGDGGFSIVPANGQMASQAVVYLDKNGSWTNDRSQAYLPDSMAALQKMMSSADQAMPTTRAA